MRRIRIVTFGAVGALLAALVVPAGAAAQGGSATIKVGAIIPVTNPSGALSLPQSGQALEASIKAFNKRGGIGGKKLELDLCDSKGDPNTEADCARQLVSDGVVATLDDFTISNPVTTGKILEDAGIARIGINFSDLSEWSSPVAFGTSSGPVGMFAAVADGLIKAGHKKLAEVIIQAPTATAVKNLLQPGVQSLGGEIVTEVFIPGGTTDYSQYVAAATKDGADAAMLLVDYPDASQFMSAMQQLNSDLTVGVSASSFTLDNLKKFSSITKKGVIADYTPNVSSSPKTFPGLKQFKADMKAGGLKISELKGQATNAWLSTYGLVTVMKGATTVDAASVLAAFKAAKDVDMLGLIPPWTPNATSTSKLFPRVSNPFIFPQKFNGKTVVTKTPGVDAIAILNAGS